MQFIYIDGFDWLTFFIKFAFYMLYLRCSAGRICHLENMKSYMAHLQHEQK